MSAFGLPTVLPREFGMEIDDRDLAMIEMDQFKRLVESWEDVREELVNRGYRVTEWRDESTRTTRVRCVFVNANE
jgi:hypothetical protein